MRRRNTNYYDRVIGEFVDQYLLLDGDAENVRQHQQLEQRARRVVADHSYCSGAENLTVVPSGDIPEEDEDRVFNYGLKSAGIRDAHPATEGYFYM